MHAEGTDGDGETMRVVALRRLLPFTPSRADCQFCQNRWVKTGEPARINGEGVERGCFMNKAHRTGRKDGRTGGR